MPYSLEANWTYFFNLENVTRNNLRSLHFEETSVTENNSLQGQGLLQLVDNRTGLEFLDETDSGVEEEKGANDTEIDPILKTCSKNSSSLSQTMLLARRFRRWFASWRLECEATMMRPSGKL